MPDDSRAHVHLVVDTDRKQRWENHLENRSDVSSLSALVRLAVEKEVSGDFDDDEAHYDMLMESLSSVNEQLALIDDSLSRLREENVERGELEDVIEMVTDEMRDLQGDSDAN